VFINSGILAVDFSGPVVSILHSDTIVVLHNQRHESIRVSGIDCPEKGQALGKRAKQAASESVFGNEVTIHIVDHDKHIQTSVEAALIFC